MTVTRFPRRVYETGSEPDPRFSLANERTYLAWIRTGLALVAAGVALDALALPVEPRLRLAASVVLLALGVVVPLVAWTGWVGVERAVRRGDPLPSSRIALPLGIGVAAVAALLALGVVLR